MADPLLQVRRLSKVFDSRLLFGDVTFTVAVGEVVAITGPSGVGKTTLLRAIAGIEPFDGEIVVSGQAISCLGNQRNDHCVLVTQTPSLWAHLSCLENVALVRRVLHAESVIESRREASRYLQAFDVDGLARRFPNRLSGGEQQRVAIARGFAAERTLVLLDEITSSIDQGRRDIVAKAIRALAAAGRSVILVSHDLPTARAVADRIFGLTPTGLQSC